MSWITPGTYSWTVPDGVTAGSALVVDAIWWAVSGTTVAKGLILTAWFVLIKRKIL
jgi:hypothetical protein